MVFGRGDYVSFIVCVVCDGSFGDEEVTVRMT